MTIESKFETNDKIMVIISIDKEPLKELFAVDEVKVADLLDEQILELIKEQI